MPNYFDSKYTDSDQALIGAKYRRHVNVGNNLQRSIADPHDSNRTRLPIKLLIFLAAPHRGMDIEALKTMIKSDPPQQLVNEIGPESPTLKDMHDRFRRVSVHMQILSVYETLKTPTVVYDVCPPWEPLR
jgi:hypothetical protein